MIRSEEGKAYTLRFNSVDDAAKAFEDCKEGWEARKDSVDDEWAGGCESLEEVVTLARKGLVDHIPDAMRIAEAAVESIENEYDMPSFQSFYDVSGSDVDVARYLSGEPECMINYTMVDTPQAGRVITVRAPICASAGVTPKEMVDRGIQVVALILALEKTGLQVEVWATSPIHDSWTGDPEYLANLDVLVKGSGQALDIGQVMFAFAHPAMFRVMLLGLCHELPKKWQREIGIGFGYGYPGKVEAGFKDGAYNLPSMRMGEKHTTLVLDTLKDLGIIG
jgi:hypothetical protein